MDIVEELKYLEECKIATEEFIKKHDDHIKNLTTLFNGRIYHVVEKYHDSQTPKKYRCNVCGHIFKKADEYFTDDERIDKHLETHYNRFTEKQIKRLKSRFLNH